MQSRYVRRFSASERLAHWLHFLAFTVLLGTGGFLYMPALQPFTVGAAGEAARLAHRVAAVVFIVTPLLYLMGDSRGFLGSLRESFSWGADDLRWLRLAWRYYTQGANAEGVPPQGKYNAGQKLNALTQIIAFILFTRSVDGPPPCYLDEELVDNLARWYPLPHESWETGEE